MRAIRASSLGLFGVAVLDLPLIGLPLAPESAYQTNVELGFTLLAAFGVMTRAAGLAVGAYRHRNVPFSTCSSPAGFQPAFPPLTTSGWLLVRERGLPVVLPSLILPPLFSGLGGWVQAG